MLSSKTSGHTQIATLQKKCHLETELKVATKNCCSYFFLFAYSSLSHEYETVVMAVLW